MGNICKSKCEYCDVYYYRNQLNVKRVYPPRSPGNYLQCKTCQFDESLDRYRRNKMAAESGKRECVEE